MSSSLTLLHLSPFLKLVDTEEDTEPVEEELLVTLVVNLVTLLELVLLKAVDKVDMVEELDMVLQRVVT